MVRQGKKSSTLFDFKGYLEEARTVIRKRSGRKSDKYQFKKFQEKLIQYVMKNIDNPHDIAPIPKTINNLWNFMDGNKPKKYNDKGKE